MSRRLWLVRHAQTEWSLAGRHTGRTDLPLTDVGRAAAARLADVLPGGWAQVLCSPLRRARETAALAGVDAAEVELRDDLMEWDYGDYEGLTTPEIRERVPGWYQWTDGCPGGEDADAVGARCDRVIEEALAAAPGDVLLVAHGHVLRVLAARWLQQPAAFGGRLALATGSVSELGFERDVRVLWRWDMVPDDRGG